MTPADTAALDNASRSDLIARAEALGVEKADVLTRAELLDEIIKRTIADPIERRLARGLLGAARDLVARVVERGLHLPDAAAIIRGLQHVTLNPGTPPIATVTLAEIYAGQGHRARALAVLDEVLAKEPEHDAARELRDRVASIDDDQLKTIAPPEPEIAAADIPASDFEESGASAARPSEREEAGADDEVASGVVASGIVELGEKRGPAVDAMERDLPEPDPALAAYLASDEDAGPETPRDVTRPVTEAADSATAGDTSVESSAEEDLLVLVSIDATTALACWELCGWALDAARDVAPDGKLILRIVAVTASWDGPISEVRDVDLVESIGDLAIGDLPARAVLRAAVGWQREAAFEPLAVALDVLSPEEDQTARSFDERRTIPITDPRSFDERRTIPVPGLTGLTLRGGPLERRARRRVEESRTAPSPSSSSWRALTIAPWEPPYETSSIASPETH
jgi:hypothetical protein